MLHVARIRDDAPTEDSARPRHRGEPHRHHPAGHGLGHREREAALLEQPENDLLHRLVIHPEDEVSEDGPQVRLLFVEDVHDRLLAFRLGGHPYLEPFDAAREECDRGPPGALEGVEAVCDQLPEARFGRAPGTKGAAPDDGRDAGPALEIRDDRAREHDAHLVGHARHRVHHLVTERADEPRRGARHLGDAARPRRNVRLAQVAEGHLAAASLEVGAKVLGHGLVADELHPHDLGDGVAGDVVLGGTEATTQDDRVGPPEGEAERAHHALVVVPHLGLEVTVDPGERELLAHPGRVRVHDLAEQQLGADRDDLASHASSPRPAETSAILPAPGVRDFHGVVIDSGES